MITIWWRTTTHSDTMLLVDEAEIRADVEKIAESAVEEWPEETEDNGERSSFNSSKPGSARKTSRVSRAPNWTRDYDLGI